MNLIKTTAIALVLTLGLFQASIAGTHDTETPQQSAARLRASAENILTAHNLNPGGKKVALNKLFREISEELNGVGFQTNFIPLAAKPEDVETAFSQAFGTNIDTFFKNFLKHLSTSSSSKQSASAASQPSSAPAASQASSESAVTVLPSRREQSSSAALKTTASSSAGQRESELASDPQVAAAKIAFRNQAKMAPAARTPSIDSTEAAPATGKTRPPVAPKPTLPDHKPGESDEPAAHSRARLQAPEALQDELSEVSARYAQVSQTSNIRLQALLSVKAQLLSVGKTLNANEALIKIHNILAGVEGVGLNAINPAVAPRPAAAPRPAVAPRPAAEESDDESTSEGEPSENDDDESVESHA